jgi:hypothetical protein
VNEQKVKIADGMWLGMMLGIGMFSGLGLLFLVFSTWDKIADKIWRGGEQKQAYIITLGNVHDQNVSTFSTSDYQGKINGQIVFNDCESGEHIIVNTSVQIVKVTKVPAEAAHPCRQVVK